MPISLLTKLHTALTSGSKMLADFVADSAAIEAALAEHNADGTHGDVHADAMTLGGVRRTAWGSVVTSGTVTTGGATSFIDSSKSFGVDALKAMVAVIKRGGTEVRVTAPITSNTATQVNFATGTTINVGDTYEIFATSSQTLTQAVDAGGMRGKLSSQIGGAALSLNFEGHEADSASLFDIPGCTVGAVTAVADWFKRQCALTMPAGYDGRRVPLGAIAVINGREYAVIATTVSTVTIEWDDTVYASGTATGGSATTLIDTGAAFSTSTAVPHGFPAGLEGLTVAVLRGAPLRTDTIISNTATQLTLASGTPIAAGDTYSINADPTGTVLARFLRRRIAGNHQALDFVRASRCTYYDPIAQKLEYLSAYVPAIGSVGAETRIGIHMDPDAGQYIIWPRAFASWTVMGGAVVGAATGGTTGIDKKGKSIPITFGAAAGDGVKLATTVPAGLATVQIYARQSTPGQQFRLAVYDPVTLTTQYSADFTTGAADALYSSTFASVAINSEVWIVNGSGGAAGTAIFDLAMLHRIDAPISPIPASGSVVVTSPSYFRLYPEHRACLPVLSTSETTWVADFNFTPAFGNGASSPLNNAYLLFVVTPSGALYPIYFTAASPGKIASLLRPSGSPGGNILSAASYSGQRVVAALVLSAGAMALYVNGTLIGTATMTGDFAAAPPSELRIGYRMLGKVYGVRVYHSALTADQIALGV